MSSTYLKLLIAMCLLVMISGTIRQNCLEAKNCWKRRCRKKSFCVKLIEKEKKNAVNEVSMFFHKFR